LEWIDISENFVESLESHLQMGLCLVQTFVQTDHILSNAQQQTALVSCHNYWSNKTQPHQDSSENMAVPTLYWLWPLFLVELPLEGSLQVE
jgi:hypothetical protein